MSNHLPLPAADVNAIKAAARDGLKIGNRSYLGVRYEDGVFTIDVGTELRQPEGTEPPSVSRRVTVACTGNNEIYSIVGEKVDRAGISLWAAQDHGYHGPRQSVLGSLASILRPGDALHVVFILGNDNQRMKDAGLTKDEAYVTVIRRDKMFATFCVGTTVGNGSRYSGMVMS